MTSDKKFYFDFFQKYIRISTFECLADRDKEYLVREYKKLKTTKSLSSKYYKHMLVFLTELFEENYPEYLI